MKLFFALIILSCFSVQANECIELPKCIEHISHLTGKKYLFDLKEIKGGLAASSNFVITSENADNLLTYILDINGYSRIPQSEKDTYIIIPSRDLRYQALPVISVDTQRPPSLIPNYDFYMMNYKFKNYDHGQIRMASNAIRPFMSRYARVIDGSNMLMISENSLNLNKLYDVIKGFDRVLSKEEIKNLKVQDEERKERIKHENEKEVISIIKKNDKK